MVTLLGKVSTFFYEEFMSSCFPLKFSGTVCLGALHSAEACYTKWIGEDNLGLGLTELFKVIIALFQSQTKQLFWCKDK